MKFYYYAITVIGKDRPGIVASVTKILYEKGFNIEDSSSTLLRNQFSMILITSIVKKIDIISLKKAFFQTRKELGISVSIRLIDVVNGNKINDENKFMISIYGADKLGIVYKISNALFKNNINIVDLRTKLTKSEKPTYVMIIEVTAPKKIEESILKSIINQETTRINVDFSVRKIETYEL